MSRVQLDFNCRSCGLAGLTPAVKPHEARALMADQLQLRCPKCGHIVAIRSELGDLASGEYSVRSLLQQALDQR